MGHVVERRWPGSTIACVASGPTLCAEDVDYLRGKVRVIAVNDGVRFAPWADVCYSSDRLWWPHYLGLPSFAGLKFGIGSSGNNNPFSGYPEIKVLCNTGADGLETNPRGLRTGQNSGYAAVNLAYHLGATRILLLGYTMGLVNGAHHFHGNHPPGLPQTSNELYAEFRSRFDTIVEPLKAAGITVLNCTPGTMLSAFPMADLREALATSSEVAA